MLDNGFLERLVNCIELYGLGTRKAHCPEQFVETREKIDHMEADLVALSLTTNLNHNHLFCVCAFLRYTLNYSNLKADVRSLALV